MTDDGEEGYQHRSLDAFEVNPAKPGQRWELSPDLGIDAYNFNVAVLEPGERLSQNAYHYHENQAEFFYLIDGELRVEVEDGSFDLQQDEVVLFEEGIPHLLHNRTDSPAKVIAIGHPPEGRHPVTQVQPYDELLAERYDE